MTIRISNTFYGIEFFITDITSSLQKKIYMVNLTTFADLEIYLFHPKNINEVI